MEEKKNLYVTQLIKGVASHKTRIISKGWRKAYVINEIVRMGASNCFNESSSAAIWRSNVVTAAKTIYGWWDCSNCHLELF
jgi:hypothetical protein